MKRWIALLLALGMALSLTACGGESAPSEQPEPPQQEDPAAEEPAAEPEPEPVVIPDPVVYTGSGDDVLEIEPPEGAYAFHIAGNSSSNHFAVKAYDKNGDYLELLVNTTDPYDGTTVETTLTTAILEISAESDWTIELLPVAYLDTYTDGDTAEGTGDSVFYVENVGMTADITGNAEAHHFAVKTLGNDGRDLAVNTTDPYKGTVMLKNDPFMFIITAEGNWKIEF